MKGFQEVTGLHNLTGVRRHSNGHVHVLPESCTACKHSLEMSSFVSALLLHLSLICVFKRWVVVLTADEGSYLNCHVQKCRGLQ